MANNMLKIKNTATVTVYGVPFHGVDEIIKYALKGTPKDGVYVGEDSQDYPCFDSYDYATENRRYWNFIFAQSESELAKRLAILHDSPLTRYDYCKLTDRLAPMAYFAGDEHHSLEITVCGDIAVQDDDKAAE